ncbi:MAG: hypothetical protein WAP55_03635 [Minisyncoccia bacterium]
MKDCVICLPLTIPSEVKTGLVLTPFVVSMLSRLTEAISICCVNLTGLRYEELETNEVTQRFESFRKLLDRLGIPIDYFWVDSDTNHIDRLQRYCERLAVAGELQSRQTLTLICQCGAVEVVPEALHADWLMDHKVLRLEKGLAFCTLCNTPLETKKEHCLMLKSSFAGGTLTTFPLFYTKEVEELRRRFNQPLLISRQKKGDYRVSLFGQTWQLDTDFCWSLLFCSLIEDGFRPSAVVVSNRSLKPLVWSLGISHKLSGSLQDITAVVTPFVQFESDKPHSPSVDTLQKLIDRYGRLPIRLIMANGLKWNQKEVVVNSSVLFWTLKALSRESIAIPNTSKVLSSLSEVLQMMDGILAEQLIADLRKENRVLLSQYQNLLLERRG